MSTETLRDRKKAVADELPPTTRISLEPSGRKIKLTIGIKNSIPITTEAGRWSSISPFISASTDIDIEADITQEAVNLYERMLPAYGFLLVEEHARMLKIAEKSPSEVGLSLVMLGQQER